MPRENPGHPLIPFAWTRRDLRLASGLILFTYIALHLTNHALGLVSLSFAEAGLRIAVSFWQSLPGTTLLYGAAATHFLLALWAIYERRTFRLPPVELVRIALGLWLPLLLIGHAATTRLQFELFGDPPQYIRIVWTLWASGAQGRQFALLAPGWLHGCMGVYLAFNRRPLFQRLRYILFAFALLVPVLAALGFLAMGKELASVTDPTVISARLSEAQIAHQMNITHWRDALVAIYVALIGATFAARGARNIIERSRQRLVTITYPTRTVRVPRGWTVLEASRSFHIPHASMCGGRARCSTCRVRVTAGNEWCDPPRSDEHETLQRIGVPADIRLACQLRPRGDISVIPLVRPPHAVFRPVAPQPSAERDVVVMFSDLLNRTELARDHLPQDLLYVLTLYVELVVGTIRTAGGAISYVGHDRICALFGLERGIDQACRQALQAASDIDQALQRLNARLSRQWDCKARIAVSIHAGRGIVGEFGSREPPSPIVVGEAVDDAEELSKAAHAKGKLFAISQPVFTAARIEPAPAAKLIELRAPDGRIAAYLSDTSPQGAVSTRRDWREKLSSISVTDLFRS